MKPELQRRVQRYGWDYSSPHYETGWQRQLWPAQERMLRMADPKPGENILDISCGTGLVSFPIATSIGPEGSLTGIDLSEGMIEKAGRLAEEKKAENLSFRHMDAEDLDFSDNFFDGVVNSLGLMYYPDPGKAVREMYRVVSPGGRTTTLVWGDRKECGWAEIFPIVDRRVESDVCPLFFQLGTGENLKKMFEAEGFADVVSERFDVSLKYETDEEALVAAFLGGAVALAYRKFDEETKKEVHREYLDSIKPYKRGAVYEVPGEFVIVSGVK